MTFVENMGFKARKVQINKTIRKGGILAFQGAFIDDSSLVGSRDMMVSVQEIRIYGRSDEMFKRRFSHQNGHISAPDKARIFNESSLKSSDFTLSGGSIHFDFLTQKTVFSTKVTHAAIHPHICAN